MIKAQCVPKGKVHGSIGSMRDINCQVLVVPVAAFPHVDGPTELVAYRPNGQWLRAPAAYPLQDVAAQLLTSAGPALVGALPGWDPTPEPVTFVEQQDGVALVFTVAVPMTTPMIGDDLEVSTQPGPGPGWECRVASGAADFTFPVDDPVLAPVLDHWRQALEETTAGFDLLPKYFTTSQLRSIYDAVWGQEQDAGNFHKWIHGQEPKECAEVTPDTITADLEGAGRSYWREPVMADVSIKSAKPSFVGTSPAVVAGGALGGVVGAAVAGAIAGGLVAYQAKRKPGKQPSWFTRTRTGRKRFSALYAPRPKWLVDGVAAKEETA